MILTTIISFTNLVTFTIKAHLIKKNNCKLYHLKPLQMYVTARIAKLLQDYFRCMLVTRDFPEKFANKYG